DLRHTGGKTGLARRTDEVLMRIDKAGRDDTPCGINAVTGQPQGRQRRRVRGADPGDLVLADEERLYPDRGWRVHFPMLDEREHLRLSFTRPPSQPPPAGGRNAKLLCSMH